MKSILLLIGDLIPRSRQRLLLNDFHQRIEQRRLPFEMELYHADINLSGYQYAIVAFPPSDVLASMPNLEFVLSLNAGVDDIVGQLQCCDIRLARLVNEGAIARIGQYVCYSVLERVRLFDRWREQQISNSWDRSQPLYHDDIVVGIMGLGAVGKVVAEQLQALGFAVKGLARNSKPELPFATHTEIESFLPEVNILVNTLPLTERTENIINEYTISLLPDNSSIINVGRGGHVVEDDLLSALDSHKLASATLDVFRTEPLPSDHPFWQHPKIKITPHVSGAFVAASNIDPALNSCLAFSEDGRCEHEVDLSLGY